VQKVLIHRTVKRRLLSRAALLALGMLFTACGGGSSSTPEVANSKVQAAASTVSEPTNAQSTNLNSKFDFVSNQPTATAVAGATSISIQSFATSEALNGTPELLADMVSYQRKSVFLKNPMVTDVSSNSAGKTTITIFQKAHGLNRGDKMAIKNIPVSSNGTSFTVNGISVESLSRWVDVAPLNNDYYAITVMASANRSGPTGLDINVDYIIASCTGKFNYLKTSLSNKPLADRVEGFFVYATTTKVASHLNGGCSPEYYGDVSTIKYYKSGTAVGSYELVAQEIGGGDYSYVVGEWDLSSEPLKSGPVITEKTVGKLLNFTNKNRLLTDGYTLLSYTSGMDSATTVFLFTYLKSYSDGNILMTTETNVYAQSASSSTPTLELIRKQIDYNNPEKTQVVISNFIAAPDVEKLATQNGYSATDAAKIKSSCIGMLLLSCVRYYMPSVALN